MKPDYEQQLVLGVRQTCADACCAVLADDVALVDAPLAEIRRIMLTQGEWLGDWFVKVFATVFDVSVHIYRLDDDDELYLRGDASIFNPGRDVVVSLLYTSSVDGAGRQVAHYEVFT